mgnify:CR=1 FL=1
MPASVDPEAGVEAQPMKSRGLRLQKTWLESMVSEDSQRCVSGGQRKSHLPPGTANLVNRLIHDETDVVVDG